MSRKSSNASTVEHVPTYKNPTLYCSVVAKPVRVGFQGSSFKTVYKALERIYGDDWPIILDTADLIVIEAMAAGAGEGSAAYEQIYEQLRLYGRVELSIDEAQ